MGFVTSNVMPASVRVEKAEKPWDFATSDVFDWIHWWTLIYSGRRRGSETERLRLTLLDSEVGSKVSSCVVVEGVDLSIPTALHCWSSPWWQSLEISQQKGQWVKNHAEIHQSTECVPGLLQDSEIRVMLEIMGSPTSNFNF